MPKRAFRQLLADNVGAAAVETGFNSARGTIATSTPPTSGAFAGDAESVEATVQENLPRMFTGLFFADESVEVSGRAVARITAGQQTCVLALDPTAPGAVTFTGS